MRAAISTGWTTGGFDTKESCARIAEATDIQFRRLTTEMHVGAKPPLPHAGLDDGFCFSLGDLGVLANIDFDPVLPLFEIGFLRWAQLLRAIHFLRDIRNLVGFAADKTEQRRGERPADLGVVHALQSVAVGAQR
jgi:hypothetical protein